MLNTLRIQKERIALESLSGADASVLLSNTFPTLYDSLKSFFGSFNPNHSAISLTSNEYGFLRKVKNQTYSQIGPLAAFVPEGLCVTYLTYSTILLTAAEHAVHLANKTLPSYTTFLSQLINITSASLSTYSFDRAYQDLSKDRDKINKNLGSCFTPGSTKAETTLSEVVSRNNDWEKVLETNNNILRLINGVDRKMLNKKISECSELLDVIAKKIKNSEYEKMSPEVIRNLADGAYQVARELEHFSITYYRAQTLAACINNTIMHFNKIIAQ